jgi:hypothetical protein
VTTEAAPVERWPPTYDAADLAAQISELAVHGRNFFSALPDDGSFCQGDVLHLRGDFPYIDSGGRAAVLEELDVEFWLLLSNSCDLNRELSDVRWAQLVPLFDVAANDVELRALRSYEYSRRFYVPDWWPESARHFVADLTMPVTVDRLALENVARPMAHLSHVSWILLHSCLVRFLARDDGRFDPGPEKDG